MGKIAIITGAGRGIGRGIAEKLAAEGATVVVTDIDEQAAETAAKELGGGAIGLRVDVTSKDSVTEMVAQVTEKFSRIDVLVNNAGWDKVGLFVDSDEADWDRVIAINLYGVLHTSKAVERDGYPLPGMRIRVVDEAGTELPPNTNGRLQVTGPFLFAGYAKRLDMTRELFDGKWFDTGDLARIDPDGYLRISGRTKDVIIRGGENIPVAYVENALYENSKIASVVVIGIPDPRLQERACACVVLKPGVEEFSFIEMQQFLDEKGLARQYWPEGLEILAELPSTASGKIQKYRLRQAIAGAS